MLLVALLAPVGAAIAVVTRRATAVVAVVQASAAVSALAWVVLVGAGARGGSAVFHVSPLVAAGGCGAALVGAAALDGGRPDRRAVMGTVLAVVAIFVALAGGGESGQVVVAGAALAGLAVAAAASVDALPPVERRLAIPFALVGLGAVVVGFAVLRAQGERWSLPSTGTIPRAAIVAFLLAGAALAVAGTLSGRRPTGVLLAGGLVLGLAAGPLRPGGDELAAVAIALAVLAVAASADGRGPAALGLLALAAAAGPAVLVPASRLLAAGSVVATAVDRPAAALAAVPGGVALAAGVVDDGGPLAACLAVATTLVAAALGARVALSTGRAGPATPGARSPWATPGTFPAVIVGAWLLLAPGSWTWTGASLRSYDRGAALGAAAALVTVGVAVIGPQLRARGDLRWARPPWARPRPPRSPWSRHGSGRPRWRRPSSPR